VKKRGTTVERHCTKALGIELEQSFGDQQNVAKQCLDKQLKERLNFE
jgi:hypothetical protein